MSRVTVFFFGVVLSIILGLFYWHSYQSKYMLGLVIVVAVLLAAVLYFEKTTEK
jgi:uncharacterized membrane protein